MHSLVVLASFGNHGTLCKFECRIISSSEKKGNNAHVILAGSTVHELLWVFIPLPTKTPLNLPFTQ